MTTSEPFVWTWLPGDDSPVVAGRMVDMGSNRFGYVYARSYLERADAISLGPELPLVRGAQHDARLDLPPSIRDACPDSWGQRVIRHGLSTGRGSTDPDWPTLMLESGSNRIGALDFQESPQEYLGRNETAPLPQLMEAAERIEAGEPISPHLEAALGHGTSIGGARPKVLVADGGVEYIAKFSVSTDPHPVVKYEAAAMELARRCGLPTATTRPVTVAGRDVLLVERFDRSRGRRHHMLSGLTILGIGELDARYDATYPRIVAAINASSQGASCGPTVFRQIAVNIAVSNDDDHARNIAAFWDGRRMELTPAYDICPGLRVGETSTQAMPYGSRGERESSLASLVECAAEYGLSLARAREIAQEVVETIRSEWPDVADHVGLTAVERESMSGRQILNPAATRGLGR